MKKTLLGLLHGLAMRGQAMRLSDTNVALNRMVRTLKYSRNPENAAIEVWGVWRKVMRRKAKFKL